MTKKSDIQKSIVNRLKTIKTSAGYAHSVEEVYVDDTPMGLDFDEFELPAIIVVSGDDTPEMKQKCWHGNWHLEIQIWNTKVTDEVMLEIVRDVYKAIFADSPTAQRNGAFRSLHPSIYKIRPLPIMSDLNMIESNRCYIVNLAVEYTTELWDL